MGEVVTPYWKELAEHAEAHGGVRLCIEMHGQQLVYNVPTLLRLREAAGPLVGANYDPSHLMWMGADPIAAIDALGDAIFHVHAKDTRIEPDGSASPAGSRTAPTPTPPGGRGTTSRSATGTTTRSGGRSAWRCGGWATTTSSASSTRTS